MILLIDNYDSFTYNLYQYLGELGAKTKVYRNDAISLSQIKKLNPQGIVLSPGPGHPDEAGICLEILQELKTLCPILGVCLGHQCIGQSFGGKVLQARKMMHGKTSAILHSSKGIFQGVPQATVVTRYHSLIVSPKSLPKELRITARSKDHEIMALQHRELPIFGVQFHPESIMSSEGKKILQNFLQICANQAKASKPTKKTTQMKIRRGKK